MAEELNKRTTRKELIDRIKELEDVLKVHHEMIGIMRDQIDFIAQAVDAMRDDKPKIVTPH